MVKPPNGLDTMMETVINSVNAQDETTAAGSVPVDVSGDVFEAFEERLEELHWREDRDDGTLYAGDGRRTPSTVASFKLVAGTIEARLVDPEDLDWNGLRTVSRPDSASTPQFD